MNEIVKKTADLACDVVDSVNWMLKKFDNPGRRVAREDAKGATAEISVPIKAGGTGEIIVVLGKAYQHYSARALRADQEFTKGTKVRVADVGAAVMFIEALTDTASGELASH